jgi:hypothetical protein
MDYESFITIVEQAAGIGHEAVGNREFSDVTVQLPQEYLNALAAI